MLLSRGRNRTHLWFLVLANTNYCFLFGQIQKWSSMFCLLFRSFMFVEIFLYVSFMKFKSFSFIGWRANTIIKILATIPIYFLPTLFVFALQLPVVCIIFYTAWYKNLLFFFYFKCALKIWNIWRFSPMFIEPENFPTIICIRYSILLFWSKLRLHNKIFFRHRSKKCRFTFLVELYSKINVK